MARYIDADLLKQCIQDNITRYFTCGTGGYCLAEDVVEDIDAFPTADVVPKNEVDELQSMLDATIAGQETLQKALAEAKSEGKWKPYEDYFTHRQLGWICTNCSAVTLDLSNGDTDYCPHCGAVMDTESEVEE